MKIKLLMKATQKLEYAQNLQNGILYMNMSYEFIRMFKELYIKSNTNNLTEKEFFHNSNFSIPDLYESEACYDNAISLNADLYIYCLFALNENLIVEHDSQFYLLIDKSLLESFQQAEYKYFTIINYTAFEQCLINCRNKLCGYGLVKYKNILIDDTNFFLKNINKPYNLFYKKPKFAFQNEFRIVTNISGGNYRIIMTDKQVSIYELNSNKEIKEFKPLYFNIGNISNFSQIVNISDFETYKDNYYIYKIDQKVYYD